MNHCLTYLHILTQNLAHKFKKISPDNNGQSLIEFVLLCAVLMTTTIIFYQVFREQIGNLWVQLVTMIVDDPRQQINLSK